MEPFHDTHTVEYADGGNRWVIERMVFGTPDGRLLGTETITHHFYRGYRGWAWEKQSPTTIAFAHIDELRAWVAELHRERDENPQRFEQYATQS